MSEIEGQEHRRRHGKHFLVPAGLLIGLGAGTITGYVAGGLLIGLGLGLLATAFFGHSEWGATDSTGTPGECPGHWGGCRRRGGWGSAIAGIFLILIGIAIIWAPHNFWVYVWPYGIGIFFIVIGLSFIARMAWRSR